MRNLFASCNTYTFQMFQNKEIPPFLFNFSFSFPTGELKQQRTFICQIHFHLKRRYLLATLYLLSHFVFRRISQIIRGLTYAYNLYSVLKWEKTFSIFRFLIMFPLNSLSVCLFHVHGLPTVCALKCPHYECSCCPPPLPTVAVCRCNHYQCCHCHQPITAIVRIGDLLLLLPLCFSWDIQLKVPFTKAMPWTTLPPGLKAHFTLWGTCVCLEPLGSRLNSEFWLGQLL